MAKRVEIRLTDNPSNNELVYYSLVIPSEFHSNYSGFIFKTTLTGTDSREVLIGTTKANTITNFFNVATAFYALEVFPVVVTQVTDGIDIYFSQADASITSPSITGDITFNVVNVVVDEFTRDQVILSRSPFNISLQPTSLFDVATMELKLYRGELDVDLPVNNNYNLSKPVIQAGQSIINFEVSKFLNDFTKSNIPTFGAGLNTTSSFDSVWFQSTITAFYLGTSIGASVKKFLAIDGFGYHTELYNPKLTKNVLSTITDHVVYLGSDYPLYFYTKDLVSITIDGNNIPFTLDANFNNQVFAYVNIGTYATTTDSFSAVFNYGTTTETHNFTIKEECRYNVYNCFFKNKFGFWQSIPFVKQSKETLTIESDNYMPVISNFGQYSLKSHQEKTTNIDGKDKISLNTDYINENYNDLFRELILSEFVYLEKSGQYLPVNKDTKSFAKKTNVNDKLIQYSMDFTYSFNVINSVI